MTEFLKFSISGEKLVYVNRNYITDFSYDPKENKTMIWLPGTENYYEVAGDQTKKILEGNSKDFG